MTKNGNEKQFNSFSEFYPYYLEEHRDISNRRLHFAGSLLVIFFLVLTFLTKNWLLLILLPVIGYGFAWLGHFFFEKNKPATFKYPLYSLMGDWVMFRDIIIGKIKI